MIICGLRDRFKCSDPLIPSSKKGSVPFFSSYDPATGRTSSVQTINAATTSLQNLSYLYDRVGNLERRTDNLQTRAETFTYDSLNRLLTADIPAVSSKSYSYDGVGNIMSKSDYADLYVYGENGYGPNAVTSVTLGGSPVATYDYDLNGNMTSGAGRLMPRTSFNKPQQITMGGLTTSFDYDPEYSRIRKIETGGKETIYINPRLDADIHYEKETDGAAVVHKHYIYAGRDAVALYTQRTGGIDVRYFHKDPLGSISIITNESGEAVEDLSYDPYGKRRNSDWSDDVSGALTSSVTHHGYTGHEQLDEIGLIHMNARLYDPSLGRFLSVDPLDFYDGKSKYVYASNNPLSIIDPLGLYDVFIGGNFDSHSRIVKTYQLNFAVKYSGRQTNYFQWHQQEEIIADIHEFMRQNPGESINLIGHSYGGTTAANVAEALAVDGVRIETLITIDPVSRWWSRSSNAGNVDYWVNVLADPLSSNGFEGDLWATLGGRWGEWPSERADIHFSAPFHHNEFSDLIEFSPQDDLSALDSLLFDELYPQDQAMWDYHFGESY